MSLDIIKKGDWPAARRTALAFVPKILADIYGVCTLFFKWSTYRYVLLCLAWGILAPLELFYKAGGTIFGLLLWMGFTVIPFVIAFVVGPKNRTEDSARTNIAIISFTGAMILFLLVAVVSHGLEGKFKAPQTFHYFRMNWYNINVVFAQVLELFQLSALAFSLGISGLQWSDDLQTGEGSFI